MFNEKERIGSWIYDMESLGFNYRITDFQAALGLSQLKKIDSFKARRREIVNYYNERFSDIDELILPHEGENVDSNFHLYILQIKDNSHFDRYDLYNYLRNGDFIPMIHYIPVHLLSYYKKRYGHKPGDFPLAEKYYSRTISIPLFPSLTDSEVMKVVEDISKFIKSRVKNLF
jgi:dTDP-4-amino-4,6-dideoxygalactose transaminase